MIIKYEVGTSLVTRGEKGGKQFGYVDGCEDVKVEIFEMRDVLNEFVKNVCAPDFLRDDWKTSVCDWANSQIEMGNPDANEIAVELVYYKLAVQVKNMSEIEGCTVYKNLDILKTIAEWVVSEHVTSDDFWLNNAKLKIFTFKKDGETIKCFLLDDVYLLNDNGKTIDIIK